MTSIRDYLNVKIFVAALTIAASTAIAEFTKRTISRLEHAIEARDVLPNHASLVDAELLALREEINELRARLEEAQENGAAENENIETGKAKSKNTITEIATRDFRKTKKGGETRSCDF